MRDPHATVAKVMATRPLNLSFRRALVDNKLVEWHNLVAQIAHVDLVDGLDSFRWNLTKSGFLQFDLSICILLIHIRHLDIS